MSQFNLNIEAIHLNCPRSVKYIRLFFLNYFDLLNLNFVLEIYFFDLTNNDLNKMSNKKKINSKILRWLLYLSVL